MTARSDIAINMSNLHTKRLQEICRICECFIRVDSDKDRSYRAITFSQELEEIYGIDVKEETNDLYPSNICKSHARHLYRYREKKSLETAEQLTKWKPKKIYYHHDDENTCSICQTKPRVGRPPKKRRKIEVEDKVPIKNSEKTDLDSTVLDKGHEERKTTLNDHPQIENWLLRMRGFLQEWSTEDKELFFGNFVNILSEGQEGDLSILCNTIGKLHLKEIPKDAHDFFFMYKDVNALAEINILEWVKDRNSSLNAYVMGLLNLDFKPAVFHDLIMRKDESLMFARVVEQIYSICSRTLISPVSFLLNLYAYSMTGSKVIVDMIGNASPSGHYRAITNWIKDLGGLKPQNPTGDVMNVFDNEQVIGKTWSIKPKNTISTSIITNKGFVELSPTIVLQNRHDLKPVKNMKLDATHGDSPDTTRNEEFKKVVQEIIDQDNQTFINMEKMHNEQLYCYIDEAIQTVLAEQTYKEDEKIYEDAIDQQVKKEQYDKQFIKCHVCGTSNTRRKLVCINCNSREGLKKAKENLKEKSTSGKTVQRPVKNLKIVFERNEDQSSDEIDVHSEHTQYSQVPTNHEGKHELIITDPVFCNPNSLTTVARVLRMIGEENGIVRYGGEKRHWTFVCCDGLPYMIIKKLKEEAVVCSIQQCGKSFLSMDQFYRHADESHPDSERQFVSEFDWIYLRIGGGHYEMNLLKSFFELNWIPVLETLCDAMGFSSEAAKSFAKSCKDNHKSWRLLMVFHIGSLQELVLPYVRDCLCLQSEPTAKDFLTSINKKYQSNNQPNFRYMVDQVCKFSQGIINFRMATRRNNSTLLKSAKYMTKELFHGRAHPKYQIIELYDTIQDLLMPDEVKELNDKYVSITTSGNKSLGEDFDFVLEEKNKQLKTWIPKGVPSEKDWLTVCRNNAVLEKLKDHCLDLFGINREQEKGTIRPLGIEEAVVAYRVLLRKEEYLDKSGDHVSVSGVALDEDLVHFSALSYTKRIHILKTEFLGLPILPDSGKLRHPVAITPSEKEKLQSVNNLFIPEIQKRIEDILEQIHDPFQYDYHQQLYQQEVKMKSKPKLLHFLKEIEGVIDSLREASNSDLDAQQ